MSKLKLKVTKTMEGTRFIDDVQYEGAARPLLMETTACNLNEGEIEDIVKCVNEHGALKQQVAELVKAVDELNQLEVEMTMRFFNPIERAAETDDFRKSLTKGLRSDQESVGDVFSGYHDAGREHQEICGRILAKYTTKDE